MESKNKTLFIFDGSSFLYRAYYAIKPLHTSQGVPIQAVYGFCKMIKKLATQFDIKHAVLVWDSKGKTTRHDIFPEYKATRQATPTDLHSQKEYIQEFAQLIGLTQLAQPGLEADDLMFSLAHQEAKQGHDVVIVSSDKDMAQTLTHKDIQIYDAFKDEFVTREKAETKFGIPIEKLPFYFALIGDSSDNIPGVKGIGPKTAVGIVNQFASLDDVYANIDKAGTKRIQELLVLHKDNAYLSQKLFTLHAYPLPQDDGIFPFDVANFSKALPLFEKLEMKSFIKDAQSGNAQAQQSTLHEKYTFICVQDAQTLKSIAQEIEKVGHVAIDTETKSCNTMEDICVGLSLSHTVGTAWYIPIRHSTGETQIPVQEVIEILKPIFANPNIYKFMHHAQFDELVLAQLGTPVANVSFDTLIAASLLLPDWQKKGLKELSSVLLDEPMLHYEDVVQAKFYTSFEQVPVQAATQYAAADAHQTLRLYHLFNEQLKNEKLDTVFSTIEMPVHSILIKMQQHGILCDGSLLQKAVQEVAKKISELEQEIFALAGKEINVNSPTQVEELLFTTLHLPPQKKSGKRAGYSTDAEVLKTLASLHPVPGLILHCRELLKLKNTYLEGLPEYIHPKTGRIHSSFNQTLVATGRLSSSNPNLQNIPAGSSKYAALVRESFYATPGYTFVAADYAQIELKILAHFSQDTNLLYAFNNGADIHKETASKIFNVHPEFVSPAQRNIGKRINFSILYGLTPFGLSKDLGISFSDAKKYIETYFEQYPGITAWMESVVDKTKKLGFSETLFGRRRYLPGIHDKNKVVFDLARRMAINSTVQGTAAEIVKLGMIAVEKNLQKARIDGYILLQIHDEILLEVKESQAQHAAAIVKESLETILQWSVPLSVQTLIGSNWHEVSK